MDGKCALIKSKGWSLSSYWYDTAGSNLKSVKLRKLGSHHKLSPLNHNDLHNIVKKISNDEGKPAIDCISEARFFAEIKLLLAQSI